MVHVVHKLPKKHKLLILGLVSAIVGLALLPSEKATASKDNSANALEIGKRYELQVKVDDNEKLTELNSEQAAAKLPEYELIDHEVRNGDNLALIFKRAGFSAQTLHKLVNTNAETRKLTKIHPGEILSFATAEDGWKGLELLDRCQPQLVITDISMPRIDGFAFLKSLRWITIWWNNGHKLATLSSI